VDAGIKVLTVVPVGGSGTCCNAVLARFVIPRCWLLGGMRCRWCIGPVHCRGQGVQWALLGLILPAPTIFHCRAPVEVEMSRFWVKRQISIDAGDQLVPIGCSDATYCPCLQTLGTSMVGRHGHGLD
jgi:hypothetical protein